MMRWQKFPENKPIRTIRALVYNEKSPGFCVQAVWMENVWIANRIHNNCSDNFPLEITHYWEVILPDEEKDDIGTGK